MTNTTTRMPSIFLAHGSPFTLEDTQWMSDLHSWAESMPKPKAVLMISAHWEERPLTLGATTTVPLVYDFYGFPKHFYEVQYAAPGAPDLAQRVRQLVSPNQPVAEEPTRGLDHGAFVPLIAMYPEADVPVLQVSLPTMDAPSLFEVGRLLAPLRDEGVLIVGSGFLTHNLRLMDRSPQPQTASWAADFDNWAEDALTRKDVDSLIDYKNQAPAVRYALPTHEHFVPVVVTMGSVAETDDQATYPITGFLAGSLTKRSVQFG